MEPSVIRPVGEHLEAGTEDAPVLDRPAPLRRLHDSGTGYKYPDLLAYSAIFFHWMYKKCMPNRIRL